MRLKLYSSRLEGALGKVLCSLYLETLMQWCSLGEIIHICYPLLMASCQFPHSLHQKLWLFTRVWLNQNIFWVSENIWLCESNYHLKYIYLAVKICLSGKCRVYTKNIYLLIENIEIATFFCSLDQSHRCNCLHKRFLHYTLVSILNLLFTIFNLKINFFKSFFPTFFFGFLLHSSNSPPFWKLWFIQNFITVSLFWYLF